MGILMVSIPLIWDIYVWVEVPTKLNDAGEV